MIRCSCASSFERLQTSYQTDVFKKTIRKSTKFEKIPGLATFKFNWKPSAPTFHFLIKYLKHISNSYFRAVEKEIAEGGADFILKFVFIFSIYMYFCSGQNVYYFSLWCDCVFCCKKNKYHSEGFTFTQGIDIRHTLIYNLAKQMFYFCTFLKNTL